MRENSIILEINEINLAIFKMISARYKKMNLDVTPVQSRIIMYIYENNEALCQKDIEKFITCNKSTLSSVLQTMEKNGLIERVDSQSDFRRKIIHLTEKSLNVVHLLKKDDEYLSQIISQDITEQEIASFQEVIKKMKKNIERINYEKTI